MWGDIMRIYGFYNEYSGQEIDTALRELTASEYRQLGNIFEDKGINLAKYHKDRENFSSSIILKFTNILEQNRRNGLTSFNQLTTNIINLINLGKTNREICEKLNIDYKTLYFELKKVKNCKRNYDREYFYDGKIISKGNQKNKYGKGNTLNIGYNNTLRFLVISDLHYGNSLENVEAVNRAFNYAKKREINIILACGDFIDGAFSKGKQIIERYFKQFEHFALDYPYDKDIITFGVGGNHDYSVKFTDEFDFIKFCSMYRDDIIIDNYANSFLNIGKETIQMHHEIKGFPKIKSSSKIILNGHIHKYDIKQVKDNHSLNIYIPTISNLIQTVPEALEIELSLNNEILENINIKEICFGNTDIILSEKEFYFNKSNESKIVEQPKVKELEKRISQIDKFNKRYGL